MAIIKTINIKSINYVNEKKIPIDPLNEPEMIWVEKEILIDDPDDDDLPMRKVEVTRYKKGDDVSEEDPKVKAVFSAIFGK